jgi:hypothetical protein
MGLVTVTNIGDPLVTPSNAIAPFTKVTFTLKNLANPDSIIVNINTNDIVEGEVRVLTDANGEFSVQLYPTDELSPQTTYVVSIAGWGTFTAGLPSVNNTQYLTDWFTNGITLTGGELSAFQNHITDTVAHLSSIEHEALTTLLTVSGGVSLVQFPFSFGDVAQSQITTVTAGKIVKTIEIVVLIAFDGSGFDVSVGDDLDNSRLISSDNIDLGQVITYTTTPAHLYTINTSVNLYLTVNNSTTQGKAIAYIYLSE